MDIQIGKMRSDKKDKAVQWRHVKARYSSEFTGYRLQSLLLDSGEKTFLCIKVVIYIRGCHTYLSGKITN